ncbi:MAG: site-specific DNA-methyltransferase [Lachnospiraceae bacterium]|nr:site-specific DNA-methyltransferase [Lachnospiraceae bacterium]
MIRDIMMANEAVTPNQREMEILQEYFPSCFHSDGSFDLTRFSEFLKDKVNVTKEGYELKFLGKNYARMLASLDTETVIVPDDAHNSKPENINSENVYISGDNLDGLKHLLKSYSGKIKCIYIDPPYNTGTDGFVYNDKFNFTIDVLMEKLSVSEEQAQHILDLTTRGSSSHSAWLMFMYPRLQLARQLLSYDGAIFISIDFNELSNLKLICNDIFGEENCIGCIANINNPKGRSDDKYFATAHEYILVYKRKETVINAFDAEEKVLKRYREQDSNGKKYRLIDLRKTGDADLRSDREEMFYPFYYNERTKNLILGEKGLDAPEGYITIVPMKTATIEGRWRWGHDDEAMQEGFKNLVAQYMPQKKQWSIFEKDYLDEDEGVTPTTVWNFKDVNSERGTETFTNLGFEKEVFPKPKPVGTIERILKIGTNDNDIVLDFFSGSATTAHAVMNKLICDNKKIKYILVQLQEKTKVNSVAEKNGYSTIDAIGQERIKRAAKKLREENPDTTADLGFKHYTLREVNQTTLDKMESFDNTGFITDTTIYDEFGVRTVLTTWLVHDNYGFVNNCKMIDFSGYIAYWCENHLYLINPGLTEEAIKAMIEKYNFEGEFNPQNIVLFGYSFNYVEMENLKTNVKILRDSEKNLKINLDIRY